MLDLIDEAIDTYALKTVFALFSGGHDSLCATHVAMQHPAVTTAVHINTGIGIEKTRQFVRNTCKNFDWKLNEYHPPKTYSELVQTYGFPGPSMHTLMYNRLKERCINQVLREHKTYRREAIGFITGVRSQESTRRMGYVEPIQKDGSRIWIACIHDWDGKDKNAYMEKHNLPRNEVVDLLHMSGECLCGAFAKPGEREEIKLWFPAVYKEIEELEEAVATTGKPCRWGVRPTENSYQITMNLPLCTSCIAKNEI